MLQTLDFSDNLMGPEGMRVLSLPLARCASCTLTALSLASNDLGSLYMYIYIIHLIYTLAALSLASNDLSLSACLASHSSPSICTSFTSTKALHLIVQPYKC